MTTTPMTIREMARKGGKNSRKYMTAEQASALAKRAVEAREKKRAEKKVKMG